MNVGDDCAILECGCKNPDGSKRREIIPLPFANATLSEETWRTAFASILAGRGGWCSRCRCAYRLLRPDSTGEHWGAVAIGEAAPSEEPKHESFNTLAASEADDDSAPGDDPS